MFNPNDLKKRKAELVVAANVLNNASMAGNRDFTPAEKEQFDGHMTEIRTIEAQLDRYAALSGFAGDDREDSTIVPVITGTEGDVSPLASKEYRTAFFDYLRHGRKEAALNIGTTTAGGYATETLFDHNLVEKLVNVNVMRQIASVDQSASDKKIVIENAIGSADWTAEAATATNDNGADDDSFSQVSLSSYKLTRIVKASEELLQDNFFSIEAWLVRKFANAFGIAEEAAFVNGAGTTKPLGVVRSASAGVTAALHADIAADELLGLFHSLKRAYRANGSFLMADSTALLIRRKKDTTGQYIWQQGLQAGKPDVLLGKPVYISDSMPTADNAGNKAVLFGDFSYYQILDRTPRSFTRLNELYAANGQVGFRGVERTDGKLTLAEAIVYLAMGAAS